MDNGSGQICGIRTVQVEWTRDAAGRWQMAELANSEKVFKADLVLLAMGFLGPEKNIATDVGADLDARGNLATPNGRYSTSVPRLYAAGGSSKTN